MTAFRDNTNTQMLITSISTIKRFIVLGDIHLGATFLQMAENLASFNEISRVKPPAHRSRIAFDPAQAYRSPIAEDALFRTSPSPSLVSTV